MFATRRLSESRFTLSLLALPALAQSASSEFGRTSDDPLRMITKSTGRLSGSLSLSSSSGARRGTGYDATLGGTVLPDRLWFFASAAVLPQVRLSPTFAPTTPTILLL